MSHRRNITRIKAVYNSLGHLKDKVVFVGGATISLYGDAGSMEVRPTDDVDILIELWSHIEYSKIEDQLRSMGFENDTESNVICRYRVQGIVVDVMPTGENVLGFNNIWYADGYKNAIDYVIDANHTVKIFSAPYFIATKLEAFKSRGKNDGRTSSDFEDIVFLLENRRSLWEEFQNAPIELKKYLLNEFSKLLEYSFFEEWVDCHVDFNSPPSTYFIIDRLKKFVSQSSSFKKEI